jgi:hypothetical protein
MPPLLGDEHPQVRRFHPQLTRQTSAGETAAENGNVEGPCGTRFGHDDILRDQWRRP